MNLSKLSLFVVASELEWARFFPEAGLGFAIVAAVVAVTASTALRTYCCWEVVFKSNLFACLFVVELDLYFSDVLRDYPSI